ncbi:aromatic-L-amino-acid decarboxylase [Kineococcus xinjiangensis]|uniref:Aromatic-L-amino-acid decarboxylase n=1 Tax=Kineococcus xinjiangensis TaxID=512762 RepID=A0A2S6IJC2_9ACTN|nr:aminotransferase class V-fold PLP-dependent enzyme [Kineococcus xinjiangensis]PPK94281.1 aromatic-L-amino-acid decarboxylase [Kineococcus xinjiangensis]
MTDTAELALLADADERARRYTAGTGERRVFPGERARAGLRALGGPLPESGTDPARTLALLDEHATPATVASNDPRYFGFVIGSSLPAAAAAERLVLAWDQCASTPLNSPATAEVERIAGEWVLEVLDLPRGSAVGFGTSATACTLSALATARRVLLARQGWDLGRRGLAGAPRVRVVVSELAHVTVLKALRVLGFGDDDLAVAPVDDHGRVDPARLPALDGSTVLCLQAGEVNTGEFDPFPELLARARAAGAWVHVDGAFGLWARAAVRPELRALADGVEGADSWTTDAHKELNTPYDCAMTICRDAGALAATLNADAAYSPALEGVEPQKNLTLEFSRRPRGISVWAALHSLGREGVAELVERHCDLARRVADGLRAAGFTVCNRVVLNQVLVRAGDDERTRAVLRAAQESGRTWFGATTWQGRVAFRISVSSWRTREEHVDALVELLVEASASVRGGVTR